MSSLPAPPVLSTLDDSLALPFASLEVLKAVNSVDVEGVIKQLIAAAESNRNLRLLVSSVLPEASWQTREELDALLADIKRFSETHSRLLDLATELDRGSIAHRRALRVAEVNQLREQAICELRFHAEPGKVPPILPGPEARFWIEWACGLKEPEHAASLQTLRNGFPMLDDFVANLEPEMWVANNEIRSLLVNGAEVANPVKEHQKLLHIRLLTLAAELDCGSIHHHRAIRVGQLNRLRHEAVVELRSQAESECGDVRYTLPGPESHRWLEWACALREPEDATALELLRVGFPKLDEFVANLEIEMWTPGKSLSGETQEKEGADDEVLQEPLRQKAAQAEVPLVPSGPIPTAVNMSKPAGQAEESQVTDVAGKPSQPAGPLNMPASGDIVAEPAEEAPSSALSETNATPEISFHITTGVGEARSRKWWMPIAIAAFVVLGVYGAVEWGWHRTRPVSSKASDGRVSDVVRIPANQGFSESEGTTDSGSPSFTQPQIGGGGAQQDHGIGEGRAQITASATQATTPGDMRLSRAGSAVSRDLAGATTVATHPGNEIQPLSANVNGSQVSVPNTETSTSKESMTGQPKPTAEKVRIVPGGAQGLVIRRVAPLYPTSARQAHIEGTVVLQALIGTDGSVLNVRVTSGHPMLIQAAVAAVKQWHFNPSYEDGQPVESDTQINVNFTLQGD